MSDQNHPSEPLRIQVFSDLHHEFLRNHRLPYSDFFTVSPDADVLVFAGDIDNDIQAEPLFRKLVRRGCQVIYVLGNHEGYTSWRWGDIVSHFEALSSELEGFHFLNRSSVVIRDVEFIGATLWTSGTLPGLEGMLTRAHELAQRSMSDFRLIRTDDGPLTFSTSTDWFKKDLSYIDQALSNSKASKKVVVTHHLPSPRSIDKQYAGSLLNVAFASDIDEDLIEKADLFIHGHTHSSFDYMIGNTRVVCNPRGYPVGPGRFENAGFKKTLIVEVNVD